MYYCDAHTLPIDALFPQENRKERTCTVHLYVLAQYIHPASFTVASLHKLPPVFLSYMYSTVQHVYVYSTHAETISACICVNKSIIISHTTLFIDTKCGLCIRTSKKSVPICSTFSPWPFLWREILCFSSYFSFCLPCISLSRSTKAALGLLWEEEEEEAFFPFFLSASAKK